MKNVDLILKSRWLLPVDASRSLLENHALVIHEGRIVDILPSADIALHYQCQQILDYPNHCLMPGLINNHTHSPMSLFRGLADDLPLMTWLNEHIWPAEAKFVGDAFVEAGSKLAIAEMLRGGTTCFNDMYFFPEATARVVDSSGIRANLGMVVLEFPTAWARDADEYLLKGQQLHDHYRNHPRITTSYAPHAPYTVSNKTLEAIIINAEEMDLSIQMHIHETADEIDSSQQQFGMRPLKRLHQLGLLSPRLTAVHMTQLTEQEITLCADTGIHIAHCPESNMKLASGFCPVAQLAEHGINITIGTDGAASNNDLDMFSELRQTALLAKAVAANPSAIPAIEAIEMATINAARSMGIDNSTGSLETGKAADIIAVNLNELETQPCYDITSQLVYACSRDKVTDVWVAGKQLMKQRQLTTLDVHQIVDDARQWASQIR